MPATTAALGRRSIVLAVLILGLVSAKVAAQDLTPFRYNTNQALAPDSVPVQGAARTYQVSFTSGASRARGMLALPDSSGRRPAVIVLHGLPGDARGALAVLGRGLIARGAVVLAIDAPWAQRNGLPDFTVRDSVEQVQLMIDLRRAVDFLRARADVDPARIGFIGGSYGGAMGALFVGIEPRLRAANLFVPDGGLVAHFTAADGTATGPLAEQSAADQRRWLEAMRPIEPILFVGRSSPMPLLIQNGRTDPFVTVEDAEALHAAAGRPREVIWYDAGHNLASFPSAKADRARFLEQHLGIPAGG